MYNQGTRKQHVCFAAVGQHVLLDISFERDSLFATREVASTLILAAVGQHVDLHILFSENRCPH